MNAKLCVVLFIGLLLAIAGCSTGTAPSTSPAASSSNVNQPGTLSASSSSLPVENANSNLSAQQNSSMSKEASPSGNKEACALITNAEIAAVQGEAVKEAKATTSMNHGFNVSQCFYTLPTFVNSVSFQVTRATDGAKDQKELRELWEGKFERGAGKKDKDREENEEEKSEGSKPVRVPGVGREAFWVGGRSNALYVQTNKNAYLRISIGGNESDQAKITKAKTLAQFAVKRL